MKGAEMKRGNCFYTILISTVILTAVMVPAQTWAQDKSIQARLVEASDSTTKPDSGLADVWSLLQANLKYKGYRTVATQTVAMTDGTTLNLGRGFRMTFSGVDDTSAQIKLTQEDESLIAMRARFRGKHPIILGGFKAGDGHTYIVILNLRQ